jgi:hypothetical protein
MKTSKYAPRTAAETLADSKAQKSKAEKEKATRLLGRLQWKAEILMLCYYKARDIVQAADTRQNSASSMDPISVSAHNQCCPHNANVVKKQAESMFKVDFFEFYTLLERYITVCLGILGVTVSGAAPQTNFNALRYYTNPDLHKNRPMASHAFHANLLEALDDEKCPLHASFGVHPVRAELGIAKEFRNAWKDADERIIGSKWDRESDDSRKNITLHDSQLEGMLRSLLAGCEHAHVVVQQHSAPNNGFTSRDFEPQPHEHGTPAADDTPFEYMDDAMELD